MHANEAGKISELAKSLYEHRLAASMEEAAKMAEQMIGTEHPGEKKSVEHIKREDFVPTQKKLHITVSDDNVLPSTQAKQEHTQEEPIHPEELSQDIEAVKLTETYSDQSFSELKDQVKDLHEQLAQNVKEFEEIKHFLKDLEEVAKQSKGAIKKEEAGVKAAEIADNPPSDIDDKLEL